MRRTFLIALFLVAPVTAARAEIDNRSSILNPSFLGVQGMRLAMESEKDLDVPYVPTPARVVKKMIDMARIGPADVVYDLGCGDGRIVIQAAKEKGAKAVGVDLNPVRIRESRENARKAKVTDKVSFLEQDLFETDISEATVLTLYLLQSVNVQLRPKILSQMKPGSRVVSYDYDMGEWEPDDVAEGFDSIYSWVVPANVSGKWEVQVESATTPITLTISQRFQKIQGSAIWGSDPVSLKKTRLTGDNLEFALNRKIESRTVSLRFEGRVEGDFIVGSLLQIGIDGSEQAWSARRDNSTRVPIDSVPLKRPAEPRVKPLPVDTASRFPY